MRPGSPLLHAVKREEWNTNYLKPGTVVEGRSGRRWVKSGRSLLPICRTCGAVVASRFHYCREHRPPRPSPNGLGGESRAEARARRRETLQRLVALLRDNPRATSHALQLAFPFQVLKEGLVAEARRLAVPSPAVLPLARGRAPAGPPEAAPAASIGEGGRCPEAPAGESEAPEPLTPRQPAPPLPAFAEEEAATA